MASVHKVGDKPNWICFYTDHAGRRRGKSTGTENRKEAVRVCNNIQEIADKARTGRITPDRARQVIEDVVKDILEASGATLDQQTVSEHFNSFVKACETVRGAATFQRYSGIVKNFLEFLGPKKNVALSILQTSDIERYRDFLSENVSNSTVNTHLKVLRVCLEKAVEKHVFIRNPARLVENLDPKKRHRRQAFKLDELRRVLKEADQEWGAMIRLGLYTGLRLSDCANLTWGNVDFQGDEGRGEIIIGERKSGGETHIIPISKRLRPHLEALPSADDINAPVFPNLAGKPESWLSNQFFELMALAKIDGIVSRKDHTAKSGKTKGRSSRRKMSRLSFHSLRHTATSLLKNANISNAVTMDIIGHHSQSISDNYTHIDPETRRAAVDKMPEIKCD